MNITEKHNGKVVTIGSPVKNNSLKSKFKQYRNVIKEKRELAKDIAKLTDQWKEIMAQTGTYNEQYHTYTLSHIKKETYGWSCRIYTPYGKSFDELEKLKPIIQDNMSCLFFYQKKNCQNFVMAKFVRDGFSEKKFVVQTVKPYEVYIGNAIDGKRVLVDIRKFPHIMLSGSNGSGKSRLLDCILTSLICNCSPSDVWLFLIQVAKNDLVIYEDVPHCRAFCDNLKKANQALDYVMKLMKERENLVRPIKKSGKGSDITDYNDLNPDNKLPMIYVVYDEYASITDKSNDDKATKELKQQIIGKVERIAQYGRALCVFNIISLQRVTADMLSPFVKAQSNLRISGKQNNMKSSEVCMDDPYVALNLDNRVFVYKTNDYDYIKTPNINDEIILKNIGYYLKPNHETIFDEAKESQEVEFPQIDTKKIPEQPEVKPSKSKQPKEQIVEQKLTIPTTNVVIPTVIPQGNAKFDKVDPIIISTEKQKLDENIKNNPNFVPFNPNFKPNIVIDKTKIDFSKTQKPVKKNKEDKK